jgi:peptidoglycan/xylan/chitin deacetylase (PgdA/CDA1 family)
MNKKLQYMILMGGGNLPKNLEITPLSTLEDMQDATEWTGTDMTVANNPVEFVYGTQSIKGTTTGGGGVTGRITRNAIAYNIPNPGVVKIRFYPHDTNLTNIYYYLGQDGGNKFGAQFAIMIHPACVGKWQTVYIPISDWIYGGGTPTWANPIAFEQITFKGIAANTSVSIGSIEYLGVYQPAVMWTWDDGNDDVYDVVYPMLQAYGMVANSCIISNGIDTAGYMTSAQLQELYAHGWDITNHTEFHHNFVHYPLEVTSQVTNCKNFLNALGLTRGSTVIGSPGEGGYDSWGAVSMAQCLAAGATVLMNDDYGSGYYLGNHLYMPLVDFPVVNIYNGEYAISNSTTLAQAKTIVDNCVLDGSIVSFYGHAMPTAGWTTAEFQELVDYVVSKNLQTLTMSELVALNFGSIVVHHK